MSRISDKILILKLTCIIPYNHLTLELISNSTVCKFYRTRVFCDVYRYNTKWNIITLRKMDIQD